MMPLGAIAHKRELESGPILWFGRSTEAPVHIPPWRQDGGLVQSWLPPSSSCRERNSQDAFLWAGLCGFRDPLCPLISCIRWGLNNITMLSNNKIKLFHHFTFRLRGGKVWNPRPFKTFPVSDVSITDLAPKVKCFGLQNVHYMGVFL